MVSPADVLTERLQRALVAAFGGEYAGTDPVLRPSQFADFQANVALALAKRLGSNPRAVATTLVEHLDVADVCVAPEVSGPGFVNLTLRGDWLATQATGQAADPRLGVPVQQPQLVPIDYSAPNVAKEMHVGHLRTTVVGDALARTLEHLGHRVVRQNHIGDWGTPFGMLIEHLLDVGEDSEAAKLLASDPNAFYQAARAEFDADTDGFADRARRRVVALQAGDPDTLRLWQELIDLSTAYFNSIYDLLDVTLTDADLAGESTYNAELAQICDELEAAGLATVSDGALCVFLEEFTGREGKPVPLIVRKSDGGYGYGTTDLATIRHRVRDLHADRVLYVVGAPQHLHLQMVFAAARKAGWLPDDVEVVHVQIGNVLGADGKILKTRSGAPLRLRALLEEAVERAAAVLEEARPELSPEERGRIARQVGIGAVKYADLSVAHDSEYTFDLDRMVSLTGNTGPYLQYAAARIRSILRRAEEGGVSPVNGPIVQTEDAERDLMLALLGFGDVVAGVGAALEPHRLCGYLFDLAQRFTTFYDQCPVLKAPEPAVRDARLRLCGLTLRVLEQGLGLLGIAAPERM
ncbi:arginine--tRNA ligase [Nocardioides panaciterrulae]|uniref:Arginine--tRNA ligase n=1 Tax=Nocardioides panaciterrulae TaxID=661492 RepID=A0A7Y9E905_9ACTN|nr:arginine--tRNA ligase [Nocardioides panaciterrulae]NYD43338.1 arginyl-tRNA synthetase [Nocardioides panaciterrulae]